MIHNDSGTTISTSACWSGVIEVYCSPSRQYATYALGVPLPPVSEKKERKLRKGYNHFMFSHIKPRH